MHPAVATDMTSSRRRPAKLYWSDSEPLSSHDRSVGQSLFAFSPWRGSANGGQIAEMGPRASLGIPVVPVLRRGHQARTPAHVLTPASGLAGRGWGAMSGSTLRSIKVQRSWKPRGITDLAAIDRRRKRTCQRSQLLRPGLRKIGALPGPRAAPPGPAHQRSANVSSRVRGRW